MAQRRGFGASAPRRCTLTRGRNSSAFWASCLRVWIGKSGSRGSEREGGREEWIRFVSDPVSQQKRAGECRRPPPPRPTPREVGPRGNSPAVCQLRGEQTQLNRLCRFIRNAPPARFGTQYRVARLPTYIPHFLRSFLLKAARAREVRLGRAEP